MRVSFLLMGILKIKAKGTDFMSMAVKEDYQRALDEQKKEVGELVITRLEQIKERQKKTLILYVTD